MELWIRSQDRSMIIKVNNIFMREYNSQADNIFHKFAIASSKDNSCDHIILGIYKKERALKILDEIQNIITGDEVVEKLSKFDENMDNVYPIMVYEMPEE